MSRIWADQPIRTDLPTVADDVRRLRVAIHRVWSALRRRNEPVPVVELAEEVAGVVIDAELAALEDQEVRA